MNNSYKILITGGMGFIGAHLACRLISEGHTVTLLDIADPLRNTFLQKKGLLQNSQVSFVRGSVTDRGTFEKLADDYDYIVHAAAVLGIEKVVREQRETLDSTILGTRNCLDFAERNEKLKRLVYLSTSEIYGVSALGSQEDEPAVIQTVGERWCYATAKLCGEYYVKAFSQQMGFEYAIVRPFNVYGPHRCGANAMTTLARRAVANETINISGDGSQVRSWCHIDDFVIGLRNSLFEDAAANQAFNIGNDKTDISILKLAEMICAQAKSSSQIIVDGAVGQDVKDRKPNIQKAKELLGYDPKIDVTNGIEQVVLWAKEERESLLCTVA